MITGAHAWHALPGRGLAGMCDEPARMSAASASARMRRM